VAVTIVIAFIFISPMEITHAQSAPGSDCPADAMTIALPLATQINRQNIPNLNVNSSDQQIASDVNMVDPTISNFLGVNVPPLNGNNLKGLSVLVTPFDDFLSASSAVNQSNPGSACNFIAATVVLATDVTVLVGGTLAITIVIALLNVAVQYCDAACILTAANNAASFISVHGSPALQALWAVPYSAWRAGNCFILGQCATTTIGTFSTAASTTGGNIGVPEFPYQLLAATVFTLSIIASYLVVRHRTTHSGNSTR
jgi:hypothetical protein